MKKWFLLAVLFSSPLLAEPTTRPSQAIGEQMKLPAAQTIDVAKLLANPAAFEGKTVRVRGTVSQVCKQSGCWMEVSAPGLSGSAFVKFTCPVDGRLVPMEAIGQPATLEGTVKNQEISEETARHYAEDAGASPEEIEKIKGPQKRLRLMSAAAKLGE